MAGGGAYADPNPDTNMIECNVGPVTLLLRLGAVLPGA